MHLRACAPSTSWVHGDVRCVLGKNAAGVSIWRRESEKGLRLQAPASLELLCHTMSGLPHQGSSTVRQRTAIPGPRSVEIPTAYFELSRRGSCLKCPPPPRSPQDYEIMHGKRR